MPMHMSRPKATCPGPECPGCESAECMSKGGCPGPSCPGCSSANCMAGGGMIKGVHQSSDDEGEKDESGYSPAGAYARGATKSERPESKAFWKQSAKMEHRRVLGEMRDMKGKDRTNLAEGGEVADPDGDALDDDLNDALGGEICDAIEAKDKKRIMEGIEAAVLSVMARGGEM